MLNFIHHAAHGGDKVAEVNQCSEQILNELERENPAVFSEPMFPIWQHRQPFQIPLIDTSKQPAHHYLYPLSSGEHIVLKRQINEWLEPGHIVQSASPYGHPVLFAEKKSRGGLHLCIDFHALNTNMVTGFTP